MLKLRFKNNKHNAVWLVEPKVVIGRSSDCDLVIDQGAVQAQHVEVLVEHETVQLRPLVATKVLLLNGKPIIDTGQHPLKVNDCLTIGGVELEIIDPKVDRRAPPTLPRQEGATGWALKANHSALSNRVFALKQEMLVGRSNECDITLAAAHLSRQHAKLLINNGQLYVKDLDSSNGTYVNGKRVAEARVKRGDELRFDTLSFGVIGPTDDIDKTTVRSVPVGKSAKPAGKGQVPTSKAAGGAKLPPKRRAPVAAAVETIAPSQERQERSASKGGVLALLVVVVAGGAFWAKSQGLF